MTANDYKNAKVREFMQSKEQLLKKRIERHNLQNLSIGGKEYELLEDEDLAIDAVVDSRIDKQIENMIHKDTKKVKKGSIQY